MAGQVPFALMGTGRDATRVSILSNLSMEVEMSAKISWSRKKLVIFALAVAALLATSIYPATKAGATPGFRVTGETLASGTLRETVPTQLKTELGISQADVPSITVIRYIITPGGVFGWQQHGGPVWAVIQSGTLTLYSGRAQSHDPFCEGKEYGPGSAFLDPGHHTYNARNEGNVDVVVYATLMLPEDGAARIDVPRPGNCPF